ncbi:amino acid adenylation domain-containing protein [Embleya sp. NBC_00888]|uniref:non-ribosomal peptide synthetase n=1 Tax=Embleya sp. NBC_00888 TaxID=2975960 RepID=UPI003867160D|nr:amino acid adenylation domain-containing protein [Embleya sp. NBC_00888]
MRGHSGAHDAHTATPVAAADNDTDPAADTGRTDAPGSAAERAGSDRRSAAVRKEEALWLLEKMVPGTPVNNLSISLRSTAEFDPETLGSALTVLLRRYEVLRTVFHADDATLTKEVRPAAATTARIDRVQVAAGELDAALAEFAGTPFALEGESLVRAVVFTDGEQDVLCLTAHHLVFDTTSAMIVLEELVAVHDALVETGRPPEELRAVVPAFTEAPPAPAGLAYWREHLAGFRPAGLELACQTPEPATTTLTGDQLVVDLSDEATAVVRRLQRELKAPEAVVLLAAYYALLEAHGAGPDLTVGAPVNLRGPRDQRAVGYHINVLPLRVRVDPAEGFRALVRRTRDVFFAGFMHTGVPVDTMLEDVERDGSGWRNSLFRHVFNYVPGMGLPDLEIGGRKASVAVVENGSSKFDLEFFLMSAPEGIRLRAVHYTEVLDRAQVRAMARRYEALLLALGADPDAPDRPLREIPIGYAEECALLAAANDTGAEDAAGVPAAVAARVAADPAAPAIEDGTRRIGYGELWAGARSVRDLLRGAGVASGDVVALAAPRGPELAAAVFGVWLAGAAYLPLDPDHPEHRIAYQLTDSRARAVLVADGVALPEIADLTVLALPALDAGTAAGPASDLDSELDPDLDLDVDVDPESCAYLIYTSGSTGRPKGTLLSHRNLANLVAHFAAEQHAGPTDVTLWMTTFTFDISALELFVPLATGGRLVVAPDSARTDGAALREVLTTHRVGIVQATPTTWRLVLADAGPVLAGLRVLCGGEPLPADLARELLATGCELWNVYGPTETTIWSTSGRIGAEDTDGGPVSVGRPIRNTRVFVAAPDGRELPVGVRGELCIAGEGVAIGYHERPELDADRFRRHPEYGRHYRTGDQARWRADGTLEVQGRLDRQVKLRGNRIELGEVEAVLRAHPEVKGAAVVVLGGPGPDATLAAFVEAAPSTDPSDGLWEHARGELPASAVPQEFFVVESFPTTLNDKIDYPALVRLAAEHRSARVEGADGAEPDDELTSALVALWRELLNRPDVDAGTNFFSHGGHSLLGAQLVQRAEAITSGSLKLADLFDHPTPTRLAAYMRASEPQGASQAREE